LFPSSSSPDQRVFLLLFFAFVSVSVVVSANESMKELMQKCMSLSLSLFCVFFFLGGGGEGEEICFLVESHFDARNYLSFWKNGFIVRLS
jgi:hypothetical protein